MRWPLPWPRRWREPKAEEPPEGDEEPHSLRESAILFARDIAVAFLVVAIVLGLMFVYTQVWPPMVVVESDSMQHSSSEGFIGVIDTGDLVLVQAVRQPSDVVSYVDGRAAGHETYSSYGDVIVFQRSDQFVTTPIIHRAIVWVSPNASGGVDVPSLARLPSAEWSGVWMNDTAATYPRGLKSFIIKGVRSWPTVSSGVVPVDLSYDTTVKPVTRAGFLTKGDHNSGGFDDWGQPIPVTLVLGKARGELPWFGLIKLTVWPGETGCCPAGWGDTRAPSNSWNALLISLVVIVVGPFLADFAWGYWKERRKASREEESKPEAAAENPGAEDLAEPPPDIEVPEPPPDDADEVRGESRTESAGPEGGGP